MQFEGIYIPVITPFHDDGSVDENGFAEVIEFLIDAGVHGIVVAGTTGEYYAQTMAERTKSSTVEYR
jgi:4-hydroxy-tetrahydrodipicolinate synthase